MKKNPIHSYLYKEYRNQVTQINALQFKIKAYKRYLKILMPNPQSHKALLQTKENLKYHQHIARYLKHEILFYNNLPSPTKENIK